MSNQDGKGITHTINATTDNAVSVNVERAAAKVTVESKASFTDNTYGGTMTDMSFTLGNMVDKFYLLQQSNYAIPTQLSYLPDGNAGTNAWVDVTLGKSVNGEDAVDATSLRGAYCMENVKNTYAQNNTTYAKFKTTFTPGKALDFEATTSDDVAGLVVKNELKDVTAPSDGETAPSFYVVLEGNEDLTSNYIMAKDITNKDGVTITPTTGGNTVTGIEGITKISSIYTNGQCYFGPIWFNIDETKSQSPVYRNDWYHLTVTKIKLPGSPQEPDPDTPDPLVPDVNVTVTATVLNWEWEPRNIELQ